MEQITQPHSQALSELIVNVERAAELQKKSVNFKSIDLDRKQLSILELLISGALSPLKGFMSQADCRSVTVDMRLQDGTFWPLPITLDIDNKLASSLETGEKLALRDGEGLMIAVLTAESIWSDDSKAIHHIGGKIEALQLPIHNDFSDLRSTPEERREFFRKNGWRRVVAFQTDKILHKRSMDSIRLTAETIDANIVIDYADGSDRPDESCHYTNIRCLRAALLHYPRGMGRLGIVPVEPPGNSAGRILLNAIISKNYGCTHLLLDDETVSSDTITTVKGYEGELGVGILTPSRNKKDEQALISESALKKMLEDGMEIPPDFSYKEVIDEMKKAYPPKERQGFTLFFTGFSGSGKSTIANIVMTKLLEIGGRKVTLLDGDIARKNLSSELNFTKEHRDLNITRIGFVANEITKNGGIAICCPIAPYESIRELNRELISANGGYIEIHVNTPIEECEKRDRKGLYAKARAGIIKGMTGIDDPYEIPKDPELRLNTLKMSPEEAANEVILYLEKERYIK
ncbi:MAG: adenylyl-sulfate kinase [bacterium]|nr:adenylyl-sulfate kinase [bacterium]